MSNPDPTSALLDGRSIAPHQRAIQQAYLRILASLATAAGLFGLGYTIFEHSGRDAGRMIIASQNGSGYAAMLVDGLAAHHGRPVR